MRLFHLIFTVSWILFAGPTFAATYTLTLNADVAQTTFSCAQASSAQGVGTVTYDDVTNLLTWIYTYGDNSPAFDNGNLVGGGTALGSHFHGPALPGVHASQQVTLGTGNPNTGSAVITPAQGADLLNNLWFMLLHTSGCPDGEIRGQVVLLSQAPIFSTGTQILLVLLLLATAIVAGSLGNKKRFRHS